MTAKIKDCQAVKVGEEEYAIKLEPRTISALMCGHPIFAQEEVGSDYFRKLIFAATAIYSENLDIPINFIEKSEERYTAEEAEKIINEFYLTQLKGGAVKNGEKDA